MAELSFPTKDPEVPWTLTEALFRELCETYPTLDVEAECRKARLWCQVNHSRRKTAKAMPRFLVNWLNKASTEIRQPRTSPPVRRDVPREPDIWAKAAAYAAKRSRA